VLPKHHAVIQVQGCFWHRHDGCSFATTPSSNVEFWDSKFGETLKRDRRNLEGLRQLGWRVAIVWECSINKLGGEITARRIARWLRSRRSFVEIPSAALKASGTSEVGDIAALGTGPVRH
jgi:DNA mismatch endonuclease (patch repair protein)